MAYKIEWLGENLCAVKPNRWWSELSRKSLSVALAELARTHRLVSVIGRVGAWYIAEYLVVVERK